METPANGQFKKSDKSTTNRRYCGRLNKQLLLMKAHFFCFNGSLAGGSLPLALVVMQLGATPSMVGLLFAVLPFIQFVSKPIIGAVSDKFQIPKTIFVVSTVVFAISLFSVNFIPKPALDTGTTGTSWTLEDIKVTLGSKSVQICHPNETNKWISSLTLMCSLSCKMSEEDLSYAAARNCSLQDINLSLEGFTDDGTEEEDTPSHCSTFQTSNVLQEHLRDACSAVSQENLTLSCRSSCNATVSKHQMHSTGHKIPFPNLVWLWVACSIAWIARGSAYTAGEVALVTILGDDKASYGKTRFFGSIGWGLMAVVAGQLVDWQSSGLPRKDYSVGFYLFAVLIACDILLIMGVRISVSVKPKSLGKDVLQLFKKPEFCLFSFGVFATGMVTGIFVTFLVVYAHELNGIQLIIGLNYFVECFFSETPFFLFADRLIDKLGHSFTLSLVVIVSGFKTLCYSFIDDAWYILIIGLMHGCNFGTLCVAIASYSTIVAPPGGDVTVQGLFHGLFEGIGWGVGNLLGGLAYEHFGGQQTFRLTGITIMIIGILHLAASYLVSRSKKSKIACNGGTALEVIQKL